MPGRTRLTRAPPRDLRSIAVLTAAEDLWIVGVGETHIGERKVVHVAPGPHAFHVRMPPRYQPSVVAFRLEAVAGQSYRVGTEVVARETTVDFSVNLALERQSLQFVIENQTTGEVVNIPAR